MYHRIADEPFDPWTLAVSPANFEQQLAWLSGNRAVLPLAEFAARAANGSLPPNAIALTFDDGYRCNAEIAAPMLERHRLPATIFLPAALIERGGQFWWDELEEIVLEHEGGSLTLDGEEIRLGDRHPDDRRWAPGAPARTARQKAYQSIQQRLVARKPAHVEDSMNELREQVGKRRLSGKGPMSPEQVRRTASALIEFGSHSLTHACLTSLDVAELSEEISESIECCEALAGKRPATFAYPFGAFDERSARLAQQAGYVCACSIEHGAVRPESGAFALPRVQAGNWSAGKLARVLREL